MKLCINDLLIMYLFNKVIWMAFLGGSDGKEPACNVGDRGLIPGSGRSPGEANGNSLQYSCLENFMDRGAWWARVHGVAKSWTRLKWLSSSSRLLCPWNSPGRNTGVGFRSLLQEIFPVQVSNPCLLHLLHWQAGSLPLAPPGKSPY